MKICIHCESCVISGAFFGYACKKSKSLIHGGFLRCEDARRDESKCGEGGKWYVEKQLLVIETKEPFWRRWLQQKKGALA